MACTTDAFAPTVDVDVHVDIVSSPDVHSRTYVWEQLARFWFIDLVVYPGAHQLHPDLKQSTVDNSLLRQSGC